MMEIRLLAFMLLSNFEFKIASINSNPESVIQDMQDAFTAIPGRLDLVFTPLKDII